MLLVSLLLILSKPFERIEMHNKILLYIVLVQIAVLGCIRSFNQETSFFINEDMTYEEIVEPEEKIALIAVKDVSDNTISKIDMEEYLIGVVAGEMPASFNEEALKAQAVAARTYAYYKIKTSTGNFDITNDATTQVHLTDEQMHDKWQDGFNLYYQKVKQAVIDTQGEVITYENEIIPAYYFSMSNGYTENSEIAFSENRDYLVSVASPENKDVYEQQYTFTRKEFCQKLEIDCNNISFKNVIRSDTGRVISLLINDDYYTGKQVKYLLNLRSNDFDIETKDEEVYIVTRGFGHGVGMSQYGANNLANDGFNYRQILAHYYTNTQITNIGSII